jgi:hypothetical protein
MPVLSSIEPVIETFKPITLAEMDNVKLMNRLDTKYVFHISQLTPILSQVTNDYSVLEIFNKRIFRYHSIYFDTPAFDLYYYHHRGKSNRYKIRTRQYADTGDCFLEIKFKTPQGRTLKERTSIPSIGEICDKGKDFAGERTHIDVESLVPSLNVDFNRITLVSKTGIERITIDIGLHLHNNSKSQDFPNVIILEAKHEKGNHTSSLLSLLKQNNIRPYSISKYSIGTALLNDRVKKNMFKPKLLFLNKINHELTTSSIS